MNKTTLLLVKAQAQLLISRIDKLLDLTLLQDSRFTWSKSYPKEKGNVKRASMELTRLLADLRQNR